MRCSVSDHRNARRRGAGALAVCAVVSLALLPAAAVASRGARHYALDHAGSGVAARTSPATLAAARVGVVGGVPGMDVSGHQGNLDWVGAYQEGARFAAVKATEGTATSIPTLRSSTTGPPR